VRIVGSVVDGDATIQALINIEAKAQSALRHSRYCYIRLFVQ
jgi:hypothetical protein